MSENTPNSLASKHMVLLYALVAVAIIILLIFAIWRSESPLAVPMIVIFGIVVFLGTLTIAAAVLKHFGLASKDEALGLPPGSVRALIALTLILIFAIMVIFLASNLLPYSWRFPANTTVIYGDLNYTNPNGSVNVLRDPPQAAIDFSNQVLTTISTLVVALAGFYFGTRSVAQAQKSTEPPQASITFDPPSPSPLEVSDTAKPEDNALSITVRTTPENEVIQFTQPDKGKIERTDDPSVFIYKVDPNDVAKTQPVTVKLKFWMINYRGDAKEYEVKVSKK